MIIIFISLLVSIGGLAVDGFVDSVIKQDPVYNIWSYVIYVMVILGILILIGYILALIIPSILKKAEKYEE